MLTSFTDQIRIKWRLILVFVEKKKKSKVLWFINYVKWKVMSTRSTPCHPGELCLFDLAGKWLPTWEVLLWSQQTSKKHLKSNRYHGFDWQRDLFIFQSLQHMNLQTYITLEPDDNLFIIHAPLVTWLLYIFTNVFRDIAHLQMRCPFQLHFWGKGVV